MAFHDIAGPILASAAVILDFQAYRELDLNYMDALKIGIENPYLRDPEWINREYSHLTIHYNLLSIL